MKTFEITVQRRARDGWPVVAQFTATGAPYPVRRESALVLDPNTLASTARGDYGEALGRALFRDDVRDTFIQALAPADGPLHVLLFVEDPDLRPLRWERLAAPIDGRWISLALGQRTPFAIHQPTATTRAFPPIGRPDLRALVVVANPAQLERWRLDPFDAEGIARGVRSALGPIPSDLLAGLDGAAGPPTLDALARAISGGAYTLLHIVAHGQFREDDGEPTVFLSDAQGRVAPVTASQLIDRLSLTDGTRGLPRLVFLSTCDSAAPAAEGVFGGLAQRLVRELGVPAVVAMTEKVSVASAAALGSEFYTRLRRHGMADLALAEAFAEMAGHADVAVPVPVLFSRLAGLPLFSLAADGAVSDGEIGAGLERLEALLPERGPVLREPLREHAAVLRGLLGADPAHLAPDRRKDRERALAGVDQVCLEAVELTFEALANDEAPPAYDPRCPFRGLEAFNPFRARRPDDPADNPANDSTFFKSRAALVEKLRDRLGAHPFLAVLGPSGSGKSSVVLAGLVPDLLQRDPALGARVLKPGPDPGAALVEALAGPGGAARLVVVDQFEEVFTLCADEGKRRAFLDHLLGLVPGHRVVITMRADFCGDCVDHPALREQVEAHQVLVPSMTADELRAAMALQAAAVGLRFETGLDATIFDDVAAEPGRMPLLQHALLELWNRRHGRLLRADEYHALGRVAGSIARTAEAVYGELVGDQDRLRDLFLRLTRVDDIAVTGEARRDTRQRVRLERLAPAGEGVEATKRLVNHLADRRLIVTTPGADDQLTEVEVAHEALIRHWPRLTGWIDESRARLRLRQGVIEASEEWSQSGRDRAFLVHQGERLAEAERLRDDPRLGLSDPDRAYVDACARQRRLRQVTAGVLTAVVAGALLIAAGVAWGWARDRDRAAKAGNKVLARQARERAETLATQNQPDKALLWLAQGVANAAAAGDADVERILRADLAGRRHAVHAHRALASLSIDGLLLAVSPDGRTLAVADFAMATRLVDLATGQSIGEPIPALWPTERGFAMTLGDLKFAPDGKTVLTRIAEDSRGYGGFVSAPGNDRASLWNAATGRRVAELTHAGRVICTAYRPKGGALIATAGDDGAVRFWSAADGRPRGSLDLSRSGVTGLAFTPDGEVLVTASVDGLRVWKTNDRTLLSGPVPLPPRQPAYAPALLRFGPGGKTLAATSAARDELSLWDLDGATVRFRRWLTSERTEDLVFGLDDVTLFTLNSAADFSKKTVSVWNLSSGQVLGKPYDAAADRLVLSPDRTRLAVPSPARLLDARTGRPLSPSFHESAAVAFTPDGQGLILLGRDRTVRVVEVVPKQSPAARPVPSVGQDSNYRFSEDGERLVSTASQGELGDQAVLVLATADGQEFGRVQPFANPARLSDIHFTPDGAAILTRSVSPLFGRIWDLSNGSPRRSNLPIGQLNPCAAYRPDGRVVLVVQDDAEHTAQLRDLDGQPAGPPFKVGGYVNWVEFHPDGSAVLLVGESIGVWDPAAGRRVEEPRAKGPEVPTELHGPGAAAANPPDVATVPVTTQPRPEARFVANGRLIDVVQAIVQPGGSVSGARHQFRDWRTGRDVGPSFTVPYYPNPVIDPDGKSYAFIETDPRVVEIVSLDTGESVRRVEYSKPVRALAAEPQRRALAVAAGDRVRFLSLSDGQPVPGREDLPYPEDIYRLAFSADGQTLAVSGRTGPIEVWETARNRRIGKPIPVDRPGPTGPDFALSRDGRTLSLSSAELLTADFDSRLFNTTTGQRIGRPLTFPEPIYARFLARSPDLQTAVVVNQVDQATTWDATTLRPTGGPVPDAPDAGAVAASPDGRRVLVRGPGITCRVHDVRSGRPVGEPFPFPGTATDSFAVFSPSGDRILILHRQGPPVLRDTTAGTAAARTLDHPGAYLGVFSRDGRVILTGASDGEFRVWSAADGRRQASLRAGDVPTLSPSGEVLVCAAPDGPIVLRSVATGRSIGSPLELPAYAARTFSGDGRRLLAATQDPAVRLWDVANGWPIGAPVRLPGAAKAVAFGQGGDTVLAVTGDGTLTRWNVPQPWTGTPGEIQIQVQLLTAQELDPDDDVIRPLSPEAWQRLRLLDKHP